MSVTLEPWSGSTSDFEAIADVWARCSSSGAPSARDLRERTDVLRGAGLRADHRIATVGGEAVGFAAFADFPTARDPDVMTVRLMVVPDHRRRGIATRLHDTLVRDIEADAGPFQSFAYVDEREQAGVAFARGHGYDTAGRYVESTVDPRTSEADTWLDIVSDAADAGIVIRPVEDLRLEDPEWFTRLHGLASAVSADAPFPIPEQPVSAEVYRRRVIESSAAMPDATFVATIGDDWVGMTELRVDGEPGHWVQDFTGVVRSHRRRGIATALKARSLLHARARDVVSVRTWNHERNTGMRAINGHLGFAVSHGVLIMLRAHPQHDGQGQPANG